MPLFDYVCPSCGKLAEIKVKSVDEQVFCFNCETQMDRKMPTPWGRVTGFSYSNGYSKKNGD